MKTPSRPAAPIIAVSRARPDMKVDHILMSVRHGPGQGVYWGVTGHLELDFSFLLCFFLLSSSIFCFVVEQIFIRRKEKGFSWRVVC